MRPAPAVAEIVVVRGRAGPRPDWAPDVGAADRDRRARVTAIRAQARRRCPCTLRLSAIRAPFVSVVRFPGPPRHQAANRT